VLFIRKKMCHLLLIKIYVDRIKKTLNVSTNQLKISSRLLVGAIMYCSFV
jgi:hypothetical protein